MASSLEKKQIDELLAKQQAIAVRRQRRVDELERQNKNLLAQISSSLIVPATAFGMSYARARYGDEASSICGMPIDATVGLALTMFATLLDCFSDEDEGAQTAAKFLHDFGNGALASWSASLGAEFGAKKRMERPTLPPPPDPGEKQIPVHTPRQMTRAELEEAVAAMWSKAQPAMPERPPTLEPMPLPAPLPIPVQQKTNPLPTAEPVAAQTPAPPAPLPRPHAPPPPPLPPPVQQKANPLPATEPVATTVPAPAPAAQSATPPPPPLKERATSVTASAKSEASPTPRTPHTASGDAKPWALDPEAEMRALLQSHGAPSDPKTVAYVLMQKNPIETYRAIVGRAQVPAAAPSTAQKPSGATKPWVLEPEAEMRRLLQSHGAPSDPKTVEYVLTHENSLEAYRAIVRGAQVPTTKAAAARVPAPHSSPPPQSPLNTPPPTRRKPRRSLATARTVGITEAIAT